MRSGIGRIPRAFLFSARLPVSLSSLFAPPSPLPTLFPSLPLSPSSLPFPLPPSLLSPSFFPALFLPFSYPFPVLFCPLPALSPSSCFFLSLPVYFCLFLFIPRPPSRTKRQAKKAKQAAQRKSPLRRLLGREEHSRTGSPAAGYFSSIIAISAASPRRGPVLTIRV